MNATAPMFLSDEVFELLVRTVPKAVLEELPAALFPEALGVTRERFEETVTQLGAEGRIQGLIGPETADVLRKALGVALLECTPEEFQQRFQLDQEDARNLLQQIGARLGAPSGEPA